MPTFKDNKNREWEIAIDAPSILRIREECDPQFLLDDTEENNTYIRMQMDPVLLCRVIYLLCQKQIDERNVAEESFYKEVIGDAIDGATKALLGAIANFTPGSTRKLLEAVAQKSEQVQQQAAELALARISDPEWEKRILQQMEEQLDAVIDHSMQRLSATSSPDSSASP